MKYIKRMIALLCVVTMMLSLFTSALAADAENSEIPVPNGDFEDVTDGFATGWSKFGGVMTAEMDTTKKYSGSKSVKITATQENNPWVATSVKGLVPGFFYEMSVFINSNVTGARGAGIKVEWYGPDDAYYGNASPDVYPNGQYFLNTNDVWVEHKTIFQVPENTIKTKLYMRVYGLGYAYYDKVTLKLSGGPEPYTFDTSHVFHYMEDKAGSAAVSLHDYYKDKDEGKSTVDFRLYDGDKVIGEKLKVPFTNLKAEYDYSTSVMGTPYKAYPMKATVKAADGAVIREYSQNIYRVDRPSMLDEKGRVVLDGEIFNPIITYHTEVSDYPKAVEGGVNTVQIGYGNAVVANTEARANTMSALKANNLKGIFCLYISNNSAGSDANFENTKQIVAMLQDNEDIIGWALKDEPFLQGDNAATRLEFERAYLAIRTIDKVRPIYVCDKRHEDITQKYCDIFCGDYYAGNDGDTRNITKEIETGRARVQEDKGFWELAWAAVMNGSYPGISAIRNTIYRAFEGGVNGIGYYSFSDAGHVEGSGLSTGAQLYNWTIWEDFKTLNNAEAPILFDYFVNDKGTAFNAYDDGKGENALLWYQWFSGGDMYLLAHNRGRAEQKVSIPLASKNGIIKIEGFSAEPVGLTTQPALKGSGSISMTLAAEEVVLYKITPDSKIDLSRLNDARFTDLAGYEWAGEAIAALDMRGIINSVADGQYGPGQNITRSDFAMFLIRTLGLTADAAENFADVDANAYYAKELATGKALGVLNGVGDNNFNPDGELSRQDMMTICARGMELAGKLGTAKEGSLDGFSDSGLIAEYAKEAVSRMVSDGTVVGNDDGTINPSGNTTRAEAAVLMYRIFNKEIVKAAASPTEEKKEEKEKFSFADKVNNTQRVAWGRSAALLKGLGISDIVIDESMTCGEFEQAISAILGTAYHRFEEDQKAIKYEQVVEALVDVLGYSVYSENNGGYLATAASIGLLKGIDLHVGEYAAGGEIAVMLDNAIEKNLLLRDTYGAASATYDVGDATLLSDYMHLKVYKGRITGNWFVSLDDAVALRKSQVAMGSHVFEAGNTNAADFIGQTAQVYADKEDNIVFIRADKNVEINEIPGEDISEKTTASRLWYLKEEGKSETSIDVSGAVLVYNGEVKASWGRDDLMPGQDNVRIISDNGVKADIIFIDKYKNYVVNSTDSKNDKVYFKDGTSLILDTDNNNVWLLGTEGKSVKVSDMNEFNILSVAEGNGKIKAILSTEKIEGELLEASEDEYIISGGKYSKASECLGTPVLGKRAVYYLNYNGLIAAVDEAITPNYGYFTAMGLGSGIEETVSVRIFTKQGKMMVYDAADTVKFNGVPTSKSVLYGKAEFKKDNKWKGQLVIYEVNKNDELTEIQTAVETLGIEHDNVDFSSFSKVLNTGETSSPTTRYNGYNLRTIANIFKIASDTLYFKVPAEYSEKDTDYSVVAGYGTFVHSSQYPNADIYDWREDFTVGAVVQQASTLVEAGISAEKGLITGTGKGIDEDGNPIGIIYLIGSGGEKITAKANEDLKIVMNNRTITNLATEKAVTTVGISKVLKPEITVSELNPGDVVLYNMGGTEGKTVTGMTVLLRGKSPLETEKGEEGMSRYWDYTDLTRAYGKVLDVYEEGYLYMKVNGFERFYTKFTTSNKLVPVVLFDKEKETAEITTFEEITAGDYVFAVRVNPYTMIIVIYR